MSASAISPALLPYVPASLLQGGELKPGVDPAQATQIAEGIRAKAATLPDAQARMFLAVATSADMAPNGKIPADINTTLDRLATALSTISTPSFSSDTFSVLARAMIEQAADQRKNALQDRLTAREQAKTELMQQSATLTQQATELKDGAKKAMITTVVMSAASMAMSIASLSSFKAMGGGSEAALGKVNSVAGSLSSIGGQFGQVGQGVSGYMSTTSQASAKEQEAMGQVDAAQSQHYQNVADIKKEAQEALNDMVKQIINFLKELQDAKAQQMQTLTRV